jgi:hypothetical protein
MPAPSAFLQPVHMWQRTGVDWTSLRSHPMSLVGAQGVFQHETGLGWRVKVLARVHVCIHLSAPSTAVRRPCPGSMNRVASIFLNGLFAPSPRVRLIDVQVRASGPGLHPHPRGHAGSGCQLEAAHPRGPQGVGLCDNTWTTRGIPSPAPPPPPRTWTRIARVDACMCFGVRHFKMYEFMPTVAQAVLLRFSLVAHVGGGFLLYCASPPRLPPTTACCPIRSIVLLVYIVF